MGGRRSIHSASITILTTTSAAAAAAVTTILSQQHIFVRQSGATPRLTPPTRHAFFLLRPDLDAAAIHAFLLAPKGKQTRELVNEGTERWPASFRSHSLIKVALCLLDALRTLVYISPAQCQPCARGHESLPPPWTRSPPRHS